jgi:hypothetical protein
MRPRALAAASLLLLPSPGGAAAVPEIQGMVAEVSGGEATRVVSDLVAFGTRYSGTAGCDGAAAYIFGELQAAGLAPRMEPFPWGAQTLWVWLLWDDGP